MKVLCNKVGLKETKIKELSTDQHISIFGSPEIKGIKGTDKRRYIIDTLRLFPRDTNYQSTLQDSGACVLRDKLLKIFNIWFINPSLPLKTLAKIND
jgi:hypothetical protein